VWTWERHLTRWLLNRWQGPEPQSSQDESPAQYFAVQSEFAFDARAIPSVWASAEGAITSRPTIAATTGPFHLMLSRLLPSGA
jgi:hypothetical protein